MIREEASNDLLQPSPLLGDRQMHSPSQFVLNLPKLRAHAAPPGFPFEEEEMPLAGFAADECEAHKGEGLRLARPAPTAGTSAAGAAFLAGRFKSTSNLKGPLG